jgi:thiamine biosynthesis protein ThiS
MRIVVNGQDKDVSDGASVSDVLSSMSLEPSRVAVERNRLLVPRARHDETSLQDGDVLEIVTLVGGG